METTYTCMHVGSDEHIYFHVKYIALVNVSIFLDKGIWISQPLHRNDISSHYYKSQFTSKWETNYKHSLLLNCHSFLAKISIAADSITRQAVDIISLSSSFCSGIHILARYVALKRSVNKFVFETYGKQYHFCTAK